MGVPKFYRWISERYPTLSEVVRDYQIPDFDNLYLDMNGIIHTCSHPNDSDPHFRISEEQIFKDIFHYIEVLFRMIQPHKVFFMAVDGVAPRAKMNQQRGRRFRSAREAVDRETKAVARGESLPLDARFDSNCITPGTEFMDRLDRQLQYFVTQKMSNDNLWKRCKVIYSGHQTPGEGEHKIMEYIRYSRCQPDYDADTRHCLYGLDADLIMLGLTSHEPHFALLREEVKFGRKEASKRITTAEETTFHLLHLSLMREYINYEFCELKQLLSFEYDIERIIDDWILMGFLVGNDFIPHLPTLHINKDALPVLFNTYKAVMPSQDGYLNEKGTLNLARFEKFMEKLSEYDAETFQDLNVDLKYLEGKRSNANKPPKTSDERAGELETFFAEDEFYELDDALEQSSYKCTMPVESLIDTYARLGITNPEELLNEEHDDGEDEDEWLTEFAMHKRNYYIEKMHYKDSDNFKRVALEQAAQYVRGLQWILDYYYNGIVSWSWYYPFHYAPYISDIKNFAQYPISFELGTPFAPFEQLLAVLPPLSVKLLPKCYHSLMLQKDSPVIDFYPLSFETDLNGKVQDWEAVVLIPFIDENRLLEAMAEPNKRLTDHEKRRNHHGPMYMYTYTEDNLGIYKSPGVFPDVIMNHAWMKRVPLSDWQIPKSALLKGKLPNVHCDLYFAGFPTLSTLNHTFRTESLNVKVFDHPSKGTNYILEVEDPYAEEKEHDRIWVKKLGDEVINKRVFVNWPHLLEAKVIGIRTRHYKIEVKPGTTDGDGGGVIGPVEQVDAVDAKSGHNQAGQTSFDREVHCIQSQLIVRRGIEARDPSVLFYCKPVTGKRYCPVPDPLNVKRMVMTLNYEWSHVPQPFLGNLLVRQLNIFDPGYTKHKTVEQHFPIGCNIFMLGQPHYGSLGKVVSKKPDQIDDSRVRIQVELLPEPDLSIVKRNAIAACNYMTIEQLSCKLSLPVTLVKRLTGSVLMSPLSQHDLPEVELKDVKNRINIGLNLRSTRKREEVRGYSKRDSVEMWLYTEATYKLMKEYYEKFEHVINFLFKKPCDFRQEELFSGDDGPARCTELLNWLNESKEERSRWQPWGTTHLPEEAVASLLQVVEKTQAEQTSSIKTLQVKPFLLYKPNPLQGSTPIDGVIKTQIWDRIVNVRDGYSVPLGCHGTVIGIQSADEPRNILYDVVMDCPFTGGLTLAGPASAQRCYRLYWSSFINLSTKMRPQAQGRGTELLPGIRHVDLNDTASFSLEQKVGNMQNEFVFSRNTQSSSLAVYHQNWHRFGHDQSKADQQGCNVSGNVNNISDSFKPFAGVQNQRMISFQPSSCATRNDTRQLFDTAQPNQPFQSSVLVNRNTSSCLQDSNTCTPIDSGSNLKSLAESFNDRKKQLEDQNKNEKSQVLLMASVRPSSQLNPQPPDPTDLPHPKMLSFKAKSLSSCGNESTESPANSIFVLTSDHSPHNTKFSASLLSAQTKLERGLVGVENANVLPISIEKLKETAQFSIIANEHKNFPFSRVEQRTSSVKPVQVIERSGLQQEQTQRKFSEETRPYISRGGVTEVTEAKQVECVVHGTYYDKWTVVQQYGLNCKRPHQCIPCLSYDPRTSFKARQADKFYELLIFFDIDHCLACGIKFLVLGGGQVLCSGDVNGKVQPYLFEKVIDVHADKVIYPQTSPMYHPASFSVVAQNSRPGFMPTQVMRNRVTSSRIEQNEMQYKQVWSKSPSELTEKKSADACVSVATLVNIETGSECYASSDSQTRSPASSLSVKQVSGADNLIRAKKKSSRRLACNFAGDH